MITKKIILMLSLSISTSTVFSKNSPWASISNIDDHPVRETQHQPYYFIHAFSGKTAMHLGECGKGDQTLRNKKTQDLIKHPKIKKMIANKLKKNEEFTATIFKIDSGEFYMNIVDDSFIKTYCSSRSKMSRLVYLDGYEIDIQDDLEFQKMYIIEKVNLKPEI